MNAPFSADQFLGVFELYNLSVWPMQVLLNILGVGAVLLAFRRSLFTDMAISSILAFLWLWTGLVYHVSFFSTINPAAYAFGALFMLQGALFLYLGVFKGRLSFSFSARPLGLLGAFILLYAMVIYPVLGSMAGHGYPHSPTFGLPCPTTIFTFGLLLWAARVPVSLLIIPFLWSLLGLSAALMFGIYEDVGLLVSALVATPLLILRARRETSRQEKMHIPA